MARARPSGPAARPFPCACGASGEAATDPRRRRHAGNGSGRRLLPTGV